MPSTVSLRASQARVRVGDQPEGAVCCERRGVVDRWRSWSTPTAGRSWSSSPRRSSSRRPPDHGGAVAGAVGRRDAVRAAEPAGGGGREHRRRDLAHLPPGRPARASVDACLRARGQPSRRGHAATSATPGTRRRPATGSATRSAPALTGPSRASLWAGSSWEASPLSGSLRSLPLSAEIGSSGHGAAPRPRPVRQLPRGAPR